MVRKLRAFATTCAGKAAGSETKSPAGARTRHRRNRGGTSLLVDGLSKASALGISCTTIIDAYSTSLQIEDGEAVDSVVAGSNVRGTLSAMPNELGSTFMWRRKDNYKRSGRRFAVRSIDVA